LIAEKSVMRGLLLKGL